MAENDKTDKKEIHAAAVMAALNGELKRSGVVERTARAVRLKNELNFIIELVIEMRKRLENELAEGDRVQAKYIDSKFIDKVAKLSQAYERLTHSRMTLEKHEKTMEAEMTPAEEMEAVRSFIMDLENTERAKFLWKLVEAHKKLTGGKWDGPVNGVPLQDKLGPVDVERD